MSRSVTILAAAALAAGLATTALRAQESPGAAQHPMMDGGAMPMMQMMERMNRMMENCEKMMSARKKDGGGDDRGMPQQSPAPEKRG